MAVIEPGEFELIQHYFSEKRPYRGDVLLGQGDDCALVKVAPGTSLAVTTDTMVAGVHFDQHVPPKALGHKLVAVNLSDLAAMGADPAWISVAVTLPSVEPDWLEQFTAGMHELTGYYNCSLIGGDTTRGPMAFTVTAQGLIPQGQQLTRNGARPGDWIYVSGQLGDAAAALAAQRGDITVSSTAQSALEHRLFYPTPRVALGQALRGMATSAIDISDGLAADLGHILRQSDVGARLFVDHLPLSSHLMDVEESLRYRLALYGGDDYELCFTVDEESRGSLETTLAHLGVPFTCVGQIEKGNGIRFFDKEQMIEISGKGYQHFGDSV